MTRHGGDTIRHGGKEWPVLEELRIGDRTYFLIEKVSRGERKRYRAVCPKAPPDERMCAVMLLPRETASLQHVKALLATSRNGNASLPRILSFADDDEHIAVATSWIQGITLDEFLRKADEGVVSRRSPTNIMMQYRGLALGLRGLHKHCGLVHGDIKPSNLVLTLRPQRIVMIDLGSAWMKATAAHRNDGDGHSEAYGAPEQLIGSPGVYDAADQFSASLVAYELLTGRIPYGGVGGKAGLPKHRSIYERQWEPPSRLSPQGNNVPKRIRDRIDSILKTALSLDPEKRYTTDDAWLEDLDALRSEIDRKTDAIPESHWMLQCGQFLSRLWSRND